MSRKQSDEEYSPEEAEQRLRNALRVALRTPPKPHSEMVGASKPQKEGARKGRPKAAIRRA